MLVACIRILAKVARVVCCLEGRLEVGLSQVDAGPLAISVVVGVADVVEMRQLVDHSLHFLRVVGVVEGEVAHEDPLGGVCGVNVSKGGTACAWSLGALADVDAVFLDIVHSCELFKHSLEGRLRG